MNAEVICTCPDEATADEVVMVGGHWPDCPRGEILQPEPPRD